MIKNKTPGTCIGLPCVGYCTGCISTQSCLKVLDYIGQLRVKIHDIETSPRTPSSEARANLRAYRESLDEMKRLRKQVDGN